MQGSFGRVVRFTPITLAQLEHQIENKNGYRTGVAVKLHSKDMADSGYWGNSKCPLKYHRVWMDEEYDVITAKEAKRLMKQWKYVKDVKDTGSLVVVE